MAQLVRAPPCHGGGRRFESDLGRLYGNIHVVGILAQLGEHLPYKQRVIGSSPIGPIKYGEIAQLARAHGSYPWCRGFESPSRYLYGILAQLGEHLPYKQRVTGSSPVGPILLCIN